MNPSYRRLLSTAIPVTATYLGFMTMAFVDLLFVGRVSPEATAGLGVGTSIFSWAMVFGIGLLAGMDYPVSFAYGEKNYGRCRKLLKAGLLVTLLMDIPLTGVLWILSRHLEWFGVHPGTIPQAQTYLGILAFSLIPAHLFAASRNFLQATDRSRGPMVLLLIANALNIFLNALWVLGWLGFEKQGVAGSASATFVSRVVMGVGGLLMCWWSFRNQPHHAEDRLVPEVKELLRLGLPSAFQMSLEVGVFTTATLIVGHMAAEQTAAHQVVLNLVSMTFMIPLGIGASAAVLVGQELGRKNPNLAIRLGRQAIATATGFMAFSAVILLLFARTLLSVYTSSEAVLDVAVGILFVAALFQVSDGAQTVLTGALRGLSDTRSALVANLLGHWFIGLPLGYALCVWGGMGLQGLWIGLATGLTVVALWLYGVWRFRSREFETPSA